LIYLFAWTWANANNEKNKPKWIWTKKGLLCQISVYLPPICGDDMQLHNLGRLWRLGDGPVNC
jgi:hypothetical protein